jgi:hypothetical protein
MYLISWTTWKDAEPFSHARLLGVDEQSVYVQQRIELDGGFDTKLIADDQFPVGGGPLVFMMTKYGAASTEIRASTYEHNRLRELFRVEGDNIEIFHLAGNGGQISVHHRVNAIDIPDLYEVRGGKFVKCNSEYPQYYRDVLRAQHLSKQSAIAPSLIPWLARLLTLSGDPEGAQQVMLRSDVKAK